MQYHEVYGKESDRRHAEHGLPPDGGINFIWIISMRVEAIRCLMCTLLTSRLWAINA